MFRHVLASLFEPASLVVISDRALPISQWLPKGLAAVTTYVPAAVGQIPDLSPAFIGVPPGGRPDLALVCVAPTVLIDILHRLAACTPRALILLCHPQPDPYPRGTAALVRKWAQARDCQVLGPRAFGAQRPHAGFNFSQNPSLARIGRVALVTQSRAIMAAVLDWAEDVHIGFSLVVALGDEAVVGLTQVLDFLASDPRTDSIALYIENPGPAREFMSALRAAASVKPVVILKAGRDVAEGADAVFDAALRRAGVVRVRCFVQLFSAVKVLGYSRRPRGRRVALLGNGNGPPQLALDLLGPDAAVQRAELSIITERALASLLEPEAQLDNPVITSIPLTADKVRSALDILQDDMGVDGVLVLLAPDVLADMRSVAQALAHYAPVAKKPVVTCFMGDAGMRPLRRMLDDAGTPAFRTPESATDAFGVLATHFYNQQLLLQTLPPVSVGDAPNLDGARAVIGQARAQGRQTLMPAETDAVQLHLVYSARALGWTKPLRWTIHLVRAGVQCPCAPIAMLVLGPICVSARAAWACHCLCLTARPIWHRLTGF
jgi:acetyltransferase